MADPGFRFLSIDEHREIINISIDTNQKPIDRYVQASFVGLDGLLQTLSGRFGVVLRSHVSELGGISIGETLSTRNTGGMLHDRLNRLTFLLDLSLEVRARKFIVQL